MFALESLSLSESSIIKLKNTHINDLRIVLLYQLHLPGHIDSIELSQLPFDKDFF